MKYMGSKRAMLQNGLGEVLTQEIAEAGRFVDLFAGSSAVAVHVAQNHAVPVLAFDLQSYSAVLAGAVITRRRKLDWQTAWQDWQQRARLRVRQRRVPGAPVVTRAVVEELRRWCCTQTGLSITRAYGGHYFSAKQAVCLDALRSTLPRNKSKRTVALAALIQAGSECAAAPGHTAQPFQPTRTAKQYIQEAWGIDIIERTGQLFASLADQVAQRVGRASVRDANDAARGLREGDLAFIDPPYSDVHYSRFYHVLETIARGASGEVFGTGRYPSQELRPTSRYSLKSQSAAALESLLETVAARGAKAILTFPDHECSNGLSGRAVREIAKRHFRFREQFVVSRFSTLGGTGDDRDDEGGRAARQPANELILVLEPR
jgi:adenine-specific DNA-methyltransferase